MNLCLLFVFAKQKFCYLIVSEYIFDHIADFCINLFIADISQTKAIFKQVLVIL